MALDAFEMFGNPQANKSSAVDSVAGDNQFGTFGTGVPSPGQNPSLTTTTPANTPGVVPGVPPSPTTGPVGYNPGNVSGVQNQANGISTIMPQNPALSDAFFQFLQSQMGGGATPFNLSAALPSSGQATTPGSVNAPLTDVLSQLQDFYKTGSGGPTGTSTLADMAKTGDPTNVTPAWQAMVDAQQRNIGQNAANLREQFAFGGDLKSSPFGNAITDYYTQTGKDQNALLAQMTQQASEAAAGRQLSAAGTLTSGASDLGNTLQGLDQQSIQNLLAEFIRTRPEYSPYLNMLFGASTTYAPSLEPGVGVGGLGGRLASSGSALSGIADLWSTIANSSKSTKQTNA